MSNAARDPMLPSAELLGDDPAARLFYPDSYFDRLVRRLAELLRGLSRIPVPDGGSTLAVASATGAYTASARDSLIACNASGGSFAVTLPPANARGAGVSWRIVVLRTDASGNTLTVQRAGSDTLDGGTSTTVAAASSKAFMSNGATAIYTVT